jgi:hypothetical protein
VARPSGCRIETRLDAWRYEAKVNSPPVTWGALQIAVAHRGKSVETSLDAADTSVRATQACIVAHLS